MDEWWLLHVEIDDTVDFLVDNGGSRAFVLRLGVNLTRLFCRSFLTVTLCTLQRCVALQYFLGLKNTVRKVVFVH